MTARSSIAEVVAALRRGGVVATQGLEGPVLEATRELTGERDETNQQAQGRQQGGKRAAVRRRPGRVWARR